MREPAGEERITAYRFVNLPEFDRVLAAEAGSCVKAGPVDAAADGALDGIVS